MFSKTMLGGTISSTSCARHEPKKIKFESVKPFTPQLQPESQQEDHEVQEKQHH